ncbi:Spherulation-specific family 4 [Metarhizium rileyi]|uniref:Spherulation-specific family 4 n=1 Tax=Metarhizium rileyi (strain RCEF 4871) TaxID=1649241 RepID=A0A162LT03_METRR|nr:Spherulation-specific family 4 [Metarhizium rileyi RCEF 4871]
MAEPFFLVPLYMYPLETAWEPLFEAARIHPEVKFVAIVNPNNGPGPQPLPDASYLAALRRMHAMPNICPVGYVHCSYGNRPAADVCADMAVYRRWNSHRGISLAGIFFDETPSQLSHLAYMDRLADYAKTTWRREVGKDGMTIYNPGVVVPRPFFDRPDYVVVFEQSHRHWDETFVSQGLRHAADDVRSKTVAIIHSSQTDAARVEGLTRYILSFGFRGIYVTDQKDGGYTQWPSSWTEQAAAVAAESSASSPHRFSPGSGARREVELIR